MRRYSIGVFLDVFSSDQRGWEQDVQFIAGLPGVEHLELLIEYIPHSKEEIAFFTTLRDRYRLIIHATSLDLTLLSPHPVIVRASIEKLEEAYKFAQTVGAEVFTIHVGLMPKFWSERETLARLRQGIRRIQSAAGPPVCVENVSAKWSIQIPYPCTAEHFGRVAKFSSMTMDTGHFMKSGVDPLLVLKKQMPRIYDIHLHDATSSRDHLPLGQGDFPLKRFFKLLNEIGYGRFVTLEVVGRDAIRSSWRTLVSLIETV